MKSGFRISHKAGLQRRLGIKIRAHRDEISSKIFAYRRVVMVGDEEEGSDRRGGAYNLSPRKRFNGPVKVTGTTIDEFRFLGVSEFPYNVGNYSGAVVDVGVVVKGIYSLVNGYSLRIDEGDSRLVQIIGVDPSRRVLNTRRVTSGLVKYELEAVTNGYELKKIKPRTKVLG